ncbi:xylulokinase [Lacibacter sediminis]|uniref:Carbohydrate kinase n=1 Tax=Lacibacter sediminis TaxID=2760713 RepID=A0A7G5XFF3_9BACT|nr:FGGY family carbohydrate kinase [Lacibacter sediminis]QNA44206.1 carbohydrate kinase [Lacibacter sediminis]
MLLLGIDIGTSSIKVSVVDALSQQRIVSVSWPETETEIISKQPGWAEQSPSMWWEHTQQAILKANATKKYDPTAISAIGISYQMHGLVVLDKNNNVLRDSIIWCDSRAVEIGNQAFDAIGPSNSLQHLLNSPGNFTASKLAWVKQNEPALYEQIDKIMLPGDYIALQLTGSATTSISALSEGVFWDFVNNELSEDVFSHYGFSKSVIPEIRDVFTEHGQLSSANASTLGLKTGIPVTYKAGDQPNNALSLNVLEAGEVAATAGTSGVIYGVSDELTFDPQSRINSFAHVNHTAAQKRIGVLLCINGTGILNRWVKNTTGNQSYQQMNEAAATVSIGSNGLFVLPFGNGAERMLENKIAGAHVQQLDFNIHTNAHLFRASQEGIAFAFRYGLDIMRENKMNPSIIRAGRANMFLSDVFTRAFVNTLNIPVELHNCDGSVGAALGAGIGAGIYKHPKEAFSNAAPLAVIEPDSTVQQYNSLYEEWNTLLQKQLS